ncbi:isochorismatase family protein [Fodinicola acaciae]|uniref:isochorismatase family protein n=1 Tax=Fodinicola acaciae TaxID=2681555 RepID=UPI0013D3FD08|nr:isochorismatase family protein [Fodinicola acaciae]
MSAKKLPAISPYAMPGEEPRNRVDWRPDPARTVLLIHDMQNYFMASFPRRDSPTTQLLGNIAMLRTDGVAIGIPIVYTAQPGAQAAPDRTLLTDFWGPGRTTACEAFMRDIQAFVVADAVADFGPDEHRQALHWIAG